MILFNFNVSWERNRANTDKSVLFLKMLVFLYVVQVKGYAFSTFSITIKLGLISNSKLGVITLFQERGSWEFCSGKEEPLEITISLLNTSINCANSFSCADPDDDFFKLLEGLGFRV